MTLSDVPVINLNAREVLLTNVLCTFNIHLGQNCYFSKSHDIFISKFEKMYSLGTAITANMCQTWNAT